MNHNYLIELGLEDLPANVIDNSIEQFMNKTALFLKQNEINYDHIEQFSTPRRLALLIVGLADKQNNLKFEAKGPSLSIAKDETGNWTKAALGFAKKNQIKPDDLTTITIKNKKYLYVKKDVPGKNTTKILPGIKDILTSLTFKTKMRWANYSFEYIRPIHWIVSLFDDQVIPFKILDIKADRKTYGHRFLGKEISLSNATDYELALKKEFVIANHDKRKKMILDQIKEISIKNHFNVQIDQDLLNEVVNIVEYPTAFMGSFSKKYMAIPDAVLVTSMKDNQRYFYVTDDNNKLLPKFISVRNGNKEYLDNVIKGNEKVLEARLDDALFFYQEDQKHPIKDYVSQLKDVSFHDDLGNLYDKMARSRHIALNLGQKLNLTNTELNDLSTAGKIYDFDLQTQMVGEFSELQGVMGEIYASLAGFNDQVAAAIFEHYLPTSANGELPQTIVGSVLAVADKIDTLISFFSINQIPTGSNDPYALRRQTTGIVRIMIDRRWNISLSRIFNELQKEKKDLIHPMGFQKHILEIDEFIRDRVDQQMYDQKFDSDIIKTTHCILDLNPLQIFEVANLLSKHRSDNDFIFTIQNLSRVQRLFKKENLADYKKMSVNLNLFVNESEKKLAKETAIIEKDWNQSKNIETLYFNLKKLVPVIVDYFDKTMINDKNVELRQNRYIQMAILDNLITNLGDLTKLVI